MESKILVMLSVEDQVQKWITKIWDWIKCAFWWFIDLFRTRYEVTVSFNKEWGDADDKSYIVKKDFSTKRKTPKIYKRRQ